jgi:hypothetical protein
MLMLRYYTNNFERMWLQNQTVPRLILAINGGRHFSFMEMIIFARLVKSIYGGR